MKNPNRPTGPTYCAGCGHDPCLWTHYSWHYTEPKPLTLYHYKVRLLTAQIEALTRNQMRDALFALSTTHDLDVVASILQRVQPFNWPLEDDADIAQPLLPDLADPK